MSVLGQFIFGETFEGENISINSRNAHLKAPKDSREKVVHEKFQTALFHYNPSTPRINPRHRGKAAAKETTDKKVSYSVLVLSRTPFSIRLLNYPSLPPSHLIKKVI